MRKDEKTVREHLENTDGNTAHIHTHECCCRHNSKPHRHHTHDTIERIITLMR